MDLTVRYCLVLMHFKCNHYFTRIFSFSEPKPLASIFLKKKALNPKADILEEQPTDLVQSVSSPTTTSTTMADNTADICRTSDTHSSSLKEKPTINQEAAKKAFNALFTGARHQKTPPVVIAAEVLPAPWPTVSHVVQKEHHSSLGVNFWSLPWPIGRSHISDDFSGSLLPEGTVGVLYYMCCIWIHK